MADDFGYHIDHHGSLVRPAELLAARAGGDHTALAAAEDKAIAGAVRTQRRLGLSAIGDGQFRRAFLESVAYDGIDGFAPAAGAQPLADAAGIPAVRRRRAPTQPAVRGRLAQLEATTVLGAIDRSVFVTLPSPGYLAALGSPLASWADIDAVRASGEALAAVLRAEIAALARDGVSYVALANPLYAPLLTVAGRARLSTVLAVDHVLAAMVQADRATLAGLDVPAHVRVGLDLTDSGPLPTTEAGYDPSAFQILVAETPFHRLCVDLPAQEQRRAPVDAVKPGVVVSLGVVDVADPTAEPVEELLARLDPYFDRRGDADLAVATNGGFANLATAPTMDEQAQTVKLRLVETLARYYWGNEI